jgi:CDP-paratose 2-epimerase
MRAVNSDSERTRDGKPVLIVGGAGFIGTNLAHRLLSTGDRVRLFDNLSRAGVERNLRWLQATHGDQLTVEIADLRNEDALQRAMTGVGRVYHLGAQVAVTTSVDAPTSDFEVNARGTMNVLEAARAQPEPPSLLFTSTNKVYGGLEDLALRLRGDRYEPADEDPRERGVSERRHLEFHSPYGCSKGAADQYVLDYARTYGLQTIVFRMSCIYGPHQFGTEDQGWVAHFLVCALEGRPITIHGDGRQVRDVLFVEDLVDAMVLAQERAGLLSGRAFNIGGGPAHTVSLIELLALIRELHGRTPDLQRAGWRVGDQRWYVSDTRAFEEATGWRQRTDVREGMRRLHEWLRQTRQPAARAGARP